MDLASPSCWAPHLQYQSTTGSNCCAFGNIQRRNDDKRKDIKDVNLAKELHELSVNEREKVFEEIHGVAETVPETPEFVANCIQQMNEAISMLPRSSRTALERAIFLKPNIETDTKFKLLFLRADDYDPRKAARRFAKYYVDKLALFGEDKLVKKITLDDLSEQDMKVFRTGFFMLLPFKDSAGRPIWFQDVTKYDFDYAESVIRCSWYQIMATLEDEEACRKGVVDIIYCRGSHTLFQNMGETLSKFGDVVVNLPCRVACYHFCYNNFMMKYILSLLRHALGKQCGLRLRAHQGSDIEIQYALMTFGVVSSPCIFDVHSKNKLHQEYLRRRLLNDRKEAGEAWSCSAKTGIVEHPSPNDILVGRGRPYQTYSGNRMLGQLIDDKYLERYMQCNDRFVKTCMHMEVAKTAQDTHGARFLERTSTGWNIVDDQTAWKKVSSSFRTRSSKAPGNDVVDVASKNNQSSFRKNFDDSLQPPSSKRFRYGQPATSVMAGGMQQL